MAAGDFDLLTLVSGTSADFLAGAKGADLNQAARFSLAPIVADSYGYLVYHDGSQYVARNGSTGDIDSSDVLGSTVIQYAIDNCRSSTGAVVLRGAVSIGTAIRVLSDTHIKIEGVITLDAGFAVTATAPGAFYTLQATPAQNIIIEGGEIDGSATVSWSDPDSTSLIGTDGIALNSTTNVSIVGVTIHDCGQHGISILGCRLFSVSNCVTHGNADDGITVKAGASEGAINYNRCYNQRSAGTVSSSGIEIESEGGTAAPYNIILTGNICYNDPTEHAWAKQNNGVQVVMDNSANPTDAPKTISIVGGIYYDNVLSGVLIQGSVAANCEDISISGGVLAYGNGSGGINISRCAAAAVSGATLNDNDSGIMFQNSSGVITGCVMNANRYNALLNTANVTFSSNILRGSTDNSIYCYGTGDVSISANDIRGSATAGISFSGRGVGTSMVQNNTIEGCGSRAVRISNSINVTVADNRMLNNGHWTVYENAADCETISRGNYISTDNPATQLGGILSRGDGVIKDNVFAGALDAGVCIQLTTADRQYHVSGNTSAATGTFVTEKSGTANIASGGTISIADMYEGSEARLNAATLAKAEVSIESVTAGKLVRSHTLSATELTVHYSDVAGSTIGDGTGTCDVRYSIRINEVL